MTRLGQTADAEAAYRSALTIKPDYSAVLSDLGMLLADNDEFDTVRAGSGGGRCRRERGQMSGLRLATLVPPLPGSWEEIERQRQITAGRIADLHARNVRIDVTST